MTDLLIGLLLLTPLLTGGLCALLRRTRLLGAVNAAGALITLAWGALLVADIFGGAARTAWGGWVWLDPLSGLVLGIVCLIAAGAALYSLIYIGHEIKHAALAEEQTGWYYLWFHLFVFTMLGVTLVNNLGIMWVFIEATTIVSALLVGFMRAEEALEAAWKYIIICTVGITFALFGLIIFYTAAGQTLGLTQTALDWSELRRVAAQIDPALLKLAFIFIVIGYGTKVGFAPMHTWLPDAYNQAPAPVAVLSGVLLMCALYGILRVHIIVAGSVGPAFSGGLLILFGLLSLAVAVPFILVQRDLKRLLAYSSVEHMGLIAIALGLGGRLALYGGLLHLLNHALVKTFLFFTAGNLRQRYGTRHIRGIRGALRLMPATGPALLAAGLGISGAPPFSTFVSEFSIIGGAFAQGQWLIGAAVILALGLIFAGMLAHLGRMAFGEPPRDVPAGEPVGLNWLLLGLPLLVSLALGLIVPAPLSEALMRVAAVFTLAP